MYKEAQELLASEQEDDRCAGIELLVVAGTDDSIELLAEQLAREESSFVRSRLIEALGNMHSAHTGVVAGRLLEASEATVRNAALAILQMLDDIAMPVLTVLMSHSSSDLRKLAADALDKISGDAACSLLLNGVGDSHPNVASSCAEYLGNRRDVRIVPALTAALLPSTDIWVAFAILDSLAQTDEKAALEVIEQYMDTISSNRKKYIMIAGIWVVAASRLGGERQLVVAWELYHDKILTISQMLGLLDGLQGIGINLKNNQGAIENLLKVFFADELKKNSRQDMVAAIRIASRNCPTLLDDE